jgi:hypothetical protein
MAFKNPAQKAGFFFFWRAHPRLRRVRSRAPLKWLRHNRFARSRAGRLGRMQYAPTDNHRARLCLLRKYCFCLRQDFGQISGWKPEVLFPHCARLSLVRNCSGSLRLRMLEFSSPTGSRSYFCPLTSYFLRLLRLEAIVTFSFFRQQNPSGSEVK